MSPLKTSELSLAARLYPFPVRFLVIAGKLGCCGRRPLGAYTSDGVVSPQSLFLTRSPALCALHGVSVAQAHSCHNLDGNIDRGRHTGTDLAVSVTGASLARLPCIDAKIRGAAALRGGFVLGNSALSPVLITGNPKARSANNESLDLC